MNSRRWATTILVAVISTIPTFGDDWPQFLGPNRDGRSTEKGLIRSFGASGPKLAWKLALGTGMSGIAVADQTAFTLFQDDANQYVVSIDVKTGKEVWKTPVAPAYENAMGHGPRATPSLDEKQVYCFSGEGILAALERKTGKVVWKVNVPSTLNGRPSEYGMSCSPLLFGNLVIVHSGTDEGAIAAWESRTGKLAWKTGSGNAGYSSPVVMTLSGTEQIVSLTARGLRGLEPASGKELWQFDFPTEYDCNTANPVQLDETHVLISAGENHGSVIVKVEDGKSKWSAQGVWESAGADSQLRAEWQTPVIHEGHLYGLDNSGSAGPITNLVCIRLSDYKTVWQKTRFGKSNLILADGRLWLTTMKGELVLVEASPEGFNELSRATVMETTRQAPTLAQGRLFVRDDAHLLCFEVSETP